MRHRCRKYGLAGVFVLLLLMLVFDLQAQRNYTLVQVGGIAGVGTNAVHSPMHGYQVQFTFGRNFYDRLYTGIGISQDIYRGASFVTADKKTTRRVHTLPIFVDVRTPISNIGVLGSLGAVFDVGYAPRIGADYHGGFMGKAGLTYGHLMADRSDLLFTLGYGIQQFNSRFLTQTFHQQSFFLSVGLFVR